MLKEIDPTTTKAWIKLKEHYQNMKTIHMRDLFAQEKDRFAAYTVRFEDMIVDYSKNILTAETMQGLGALAEETELSDAIEKMFSGDRINKTETARSFMSPCGTVPKRRYIRMETISCRKYRKFLIK